MVVQILFNTLVLRSLFEDNGIIGCLCRLLGILFIFIPIIIKQIFFYRRNGFPFCVLGEYPALTYSELLSNKNEIASKIEKLKSTGQVLSKAHLQEILHDLPRHSSFSLPQQQEALQQSIFKKLLKVLRRLYLSCHYTDKKCVK